MKEGYGWEAQHVAPLQPIKYFVETASDNTGIVPTIRHIMRRDSIHAVRDIKTDNAGIVPTIRHIMRRDSIHAVRKKDNIGVGTASILSEKKTT
jgi:predicted butyrate kinase (DUF1464 family)